MLEIVSIYFQTAPEDYIKIQLGTHTCQELGPVFRMVLRRKNAVPKATLVPTMGICGDLPENEHIGRQDQQRRG
jgi:hypothetical protein